MSEPVLTLAVVGHTNAGKTSLLRTLTRRVDFGAISDQPGTTRHTEKVSLWLDEHAELHFLDTPGLEDAIALQEFLQSQTGASPYQRVQAFLQGPEAHGVFEQEAKVLRALSQNVDAAILVIDSRETVLPKHRSEIEILASCARPIMPVLNFVADPLMRLQQWHQLLAEYHLHARAEFDAVAPFHGAEALLYQDLASLLPDKRVLLAHIVQRLQEQFQHQCRALSRVLASGLINMAAMRRLLAPESASRQNVESAQVMQFRKELTEHVRTCCRQLMQVLQFRESDLQVREITNSLERWERDLFQPELLKLVGQRLGAGALVGAGLGAVADLALAGLSLGAASALGATLGGAASGGWQPIWKKLRGQMGGQQELTVSDAVLLLLIDRLCTLTRSLLERGHAAQDILQLDIQTARMAAQDQQASEILRTLRVARSHPEWEQSQRSGKHADPEREACVQQLERQLLPKITSFASQSSPDDLSV